MYKPMWKGGDVLYLYVPVLELEELLSMKRALPEYKVRHAEPYSAAFRVTVCDLVLSRVLPASPVLNEDPCAETQ